MSRVPLSELIYQGANPVRTAPGRQVFVYQRGTKEQATIYAAETGEATVSQPLVTNASGLPASSGSQVWVVAGAYTFEVAGSSVPVQINSSLQTTSEVLNVSEFGADGTGVKDSTAAFEKAIAALPAEGGEIFCPRRYKLSGQLNFDQKRSVRLTGAAGVSAGAGTASALIFTQGGTTPMISALSALGIHISDLSILQTSESFTGKIIDFGSDGVHGQNTYSSIERCMIAGTGRTATGLSINKTAGFALRNCHLTALALGVQGKGENTDASNGIQIVGNLFNEMETAAIKNAGEAWLIQGNVGENLHSGNAGFYIHDTGVVARATSFIGNWFGDANSSGTWLSWQGAGLVVAANLFGAGAVALDIPDSGSSGISAIGNRLDSPTTGIQLASGVTNYNTAGNQYNGVTNQVKIAGTAFTDTGIAGGAGKAALQLPDTSSTPGITFGNDTNLYRLEANVLATDDQIRLLGGSGTVAFLQRKSSDTAARFRLTEEGKLELGDGTTVDTNIYRKEANVLKTDDSFHIGEFLSHLGTKAGLYGVTPVSRATAITSPAAELAALKTAVDAIRTAIKNVGITE